MAKKLSDIKNSIEEDNEEFYSFFFNSIDKEIKAFILKMMTDTKVYIFSGIIRDFYLNRKKKISFRDIDIIIEDDIAVEKYFNEWKFRRNSFSGYKIEVSNIIIDLWVVKNTWAFNNGQLKIEFSHLSELPKTTFFNFSSILYSLNNKSFIIGKDFLRFIRDKKIELVLVENPYPELCIVNSFYYSDKLNLKFGDKLKEYLKTNFKKYLNNLEYIQLKHFNKIVYSLTELEDKIENLELTSSNKTLQG